METNRSTYNAERAAEQQAFDFDVIDEMDPSLSQGVNKVLFDEELNMRIHFIEPDNSIHSQEDPEKVRTRIFSCQNNKDTYFRVELTSENDIFFFYMHIVDRESFDIIKVDQKLNSDFIDYPGQCIKLFRECISNQDGSFWPEFTIHYDGSGRLEIIKENSFRKYKVLLIDFSPMPDDMVKQSITYRFGSQRSKLNIVEGRVLDVMEIVRQRNPSQQLQIEKSLK